MAFPSTNITLKQVCDAYGVASNIAALRGKYFYTASPPSALQQVPLTGPISLSLFIGKTPYTGPQRSSNVIITSLGIISYPPNAPIPISFYIAFLGGGGGGGGGGAGGFAVGGGVGGGGGGGAIIQSTISYDGSAINVTSLPTQGTGGKGTDGNGGAESGTAGGDATITFKGNTYSAGGGGAGGAGTDGGGSGNGGSGGQVVLPSGTGGGVPGTAADYQIAGSPNGGNGGNAGSPIYQGGGGGSDGTAGSADIQWIYY